MIREAKVQNKEHDLTGHGREQRGGGRCLRLEDWNAVRLLKAMCTMLRGLAFIQYSVGEQNIL